MSTNLDQITQSLRERIMSGAYGSNDKLAEIALAETLGGSRTLVRLALSALEQESLVRREPNRGFRVRGYSLDEVTHAIAVRGELEAMAARLAAERGLDVETEKLIGKTVTEMDEVFVQGFESLPARTRWIELNGHFHSYIIEASGNTAIADTITQLSRRPLVSSHAIVFDLTDPVLTKSQIKIAHDDHLAILDAILNRQGGRAAARMREHALASGRNKRKNIDAKNRGDLVQRLPGVDLVLTA